jgi:hypothetical protein
MCEASESLADAHVNLFRSSFDSIPVQTLTLAQALEAIRTGVYERRVRRVRQVLARDGKRAYDQAKASLPAVTFAGSFAARRGNAHLQQHTGIVHGDLDHLNDVVAAKQALCGDPRTVYVFISPSETGLKLGIHVTMVADDTTYKHAWAAASAEYEARYGGQWDPSGKDIARLCFVSHDPDLYWNPKAIVFDVPPVPVRETRPPTPATPRPAAPWPHEDRRRYAEQAIRTAVQMIEAAEPGTRHHTRLRAARLLGGYVAGGLVTEDHAYGALAQALIGHTDDLARALKTIEDGLAYGKAYPITREALEAEREARLDAHRQQTISVNRERRRTVSGKSDDQGMILLPLRPYAPYRGPRKGGGWHG